MTETILALNAGSSSLKFALFERSAPRNALKTIARGAIRIGRAGTQITVTGSDDGNILDEEWAETAADALVEHLLGWIEAAFREARIAAVGHRIVHGGAEFADPVMIDDDVLARLSALTPLAPLHQPAGLAPIRVVARIRPNLAQVACFDTAFHRTISPPASRYALPRAYERQGIRRYGFHGLSYESIAAQLREEGDAEGRASRSRVIVAHLGSGASLCAMRDLKSVDTTMGFSALDGLVMGTRSGALDPGILLYLLKEQGFSPGGLEHLLYRESGLLGVSGISSDVGVLLASSELAAREALELFAFQIARHAGALSATLGGLDRFIFTGGIGEHAAAVRAMTVRRLQWLGAKLDEEANASGATCISGRESSLLVERRSTSEELAIAGHVSALLKGTRTA